MRAVGVSGGVLERQTRRCATNARRNIETDLAAAQVQTTVEQMKTKLQEQDLTKGMT